MQYLTHGYTQITLPIYFSASTSLSFSPSTSHLRPTGQLLSTSVLLGPITRLCVIRGVQFYLTILLYSLYVWLCLWLYVHLYMNSCVYVCVLRACIVKGNSPFKFIRFISFQIWMEHMKIFWMSVGNRTTLDTNDFSSLRPFSKYLLFHCKIWLLQFETTLKI